MLSFTTLTCIYIAGTFPTITFGVSKFIVTNIYVHFRKQIKLHINDPNEQNSKNVFELSK